MNPKTISIGDWIVTIHKFGLALLLSLAVWGVVPVLVVMLIGAVVGGAGG